MNVLRKTRPLWSITRRSFIVRDYALCARPSTVYTGKYSPKHAFSTSATYSAAPGGDYGNYIVHSPWGTPAIPDDVNMTEFLLNQFTAAPGKVALVNSDTDETITYSQLGDHVRSLSNSLIQQGVEPGDIVAVCSPNTLEMALLLLAVPATGACAAAMSISLTQHDAEALLDRGPVDFLVTLPQLLPVFASRSSTFKKVFTIGDSTEHKSIRQLVKEGSPSKLPNIRIDPFKDVALITYSSGTTGFPKGVKLSHHNIIASVVAASTPSCSLIDDDEIAIGTFPFAHIAGSVSTLMNTLYMNATMVLMEKFDFLKYLEYNEKFKATMLLVPPPVGVRLLNDPHCLNDYDISTVCKIISGAAHISDVVQEGLCKKLNLKNFRQGYGMSEVAGISHIDDKVNFKFGSAGLTMPNMSSKIVDTDTGEDLPPSSTGEVYIAGPQIMLGYLNNPEATADIITEDGWLSTGDIGHFDEDGNLFITDRCKDLIKYKGLQVAPAELEGVLLGHPLVLDVGVIGVPDDRAGEVPLAFIVLQQGVEAGGKTEKDIIQYVADKVAPYKRLRGGVTFVKDIPKLPSGKILRRVLRQLA